MSSNVRPFKVLLEEVLFEVLQENTVHMYIFRNVFKIRPSKAISLIGIQIEDSKNAFQKKNTAISPYKKTSHVSKR